MFVAFGDAAEPSLTLATPQGLVFVAVDDFVGSLALPPHRRFETFRSRLADIYGFGFEVERFHLDREVIDTETIVELSANNAEQFGM